MRGENAILQGQVIGYDLGPVLSELVDFNVQITIIFIYTHSVGTSTISKRLYLIREELLVGIEEVVIFSMINMWDLRLHAPLL